MKLLDHIRTLATTAGMLRQWIRWNLGWLGIHPYLKLPGGDKVSGFRNFSEFWSAQATVPGDDEVAFINRYAGKSGVLLDVGANLGCFSLTLARLRPDCMVHAFEPSPETLILLQANIARSQQINVNIHPFALGKKIDHLLFINDPSSPATNRLVDQEEAASNRTIEVEVTTIDQFLKMNGTPNVAFMKIDVEGFEADVLRGAALTLTHCGCQAGLIELCPNNLHRAGSSVEAILNVLSQAGWRLHFLCAGGSPGPIVTPSNAKTISVANVGMFAG